MARKAVLSCIAIQTIAAAFAQPAAQSLPMEPAHSSGQSITGALEGWYENKDGSAYILVGYFNRNLTQELDIPVGADNRIEPGGPDRGQPTHFLPGRQWGVFTIRVPKDTGKLTWTIRANGKTTVIPLHLDPLWIVSPLLDASANTPPFISFDAKSPGVQGPPSSAMLTLQAKAGQPVPLTVWVSDDAKVGLGPSLAARGPAVTVKWTYFRGPASPVRFTNPRPPVQRRSDGVREGFAGSATTEAVFRDPGEYIIEVAANDWSGEGGSGFQCCWSTAQVKVIVER